MDKYREEYRMKKSVGILLALLLVMLCFGAAGEAEVSSDAVTLTVNPNTGLLLYQNVAYIVHAKGATNAALVFLDGEYEDVIYLDEYTEPDEYDTWFSWPGPPITAGKLESMRKPALTMAPPGFPVKCRH